MGRLEQRSLGGGIILPYDLILKAQITDLYVCLILLMILPSGHMFNANGLDLARFLIPSHLTPLLMVAPIPHDFCPCRCLDLPPSCFGGPRDLLFPLPPGENLVGSNPTKSYEDSSCEGGGESINKRCFDYPV